MNRIDTHQRRRIAAALATADAKARMTGVGGEVLPGTVRSFAQVIHNDRIRYEKIAREAHIKPD